MNLFGKSNRILIEEKKKFCSIRNSIESKGIIETSKTFDIEIISFNSAIVSYSFEEIDLLTDKPTYCNEILVTPSNSFKKYENKLFIVEVNNNIKIIDPSDQRFHNVNVSIISILQDLKTQNKDPIFYLLLQLPKTKKYCFVVMSNNLDNFLITPYTLIKITDTDLAFPIIKKTNEPQILISGVYNNMKYIISFEEEIPILTIVTSLKFNIKK